MKEGTRGQTFEVWFYIGALLTIYGTMLSLAGVYQWIHPPMTVLSKEHATFWAGMLLLLVGGGYVLAYWPPRRSRRKAGENA